MSTMYVMSDQLRLLIPLKNAKKGERTRLATRIKTISVIGCTFLPLIDFINMLTDSINDCTKQAITPNILPS